MERGEREKVIKEEHEDNLGNNRYVHPVYYRDGFKDVYICQNTKLFTVNMHLIISQ